MFNDESYLDEHVRPRVQPKAKGVTYEDDGGSDTIYAGPIHKAYLAKVYTTLACISSVAWMGSYAVERNYVTPSLWWALLQFISIYLLAFSPTTQRWKLGRLQSTPTTNEYLLKWFCVAVFSFCSGNVIGYTSNLTSHLVSNFTMNLTANFPIINDYFGVIGGELDRKFTSDSLLLTAATFFLFAFCSLVSHSDFLFLMTCIASIGTMIVFWPTVGSLLNLASLLKYDPNKLQLAHAIGSLYIMIESYVIENEVREGRKDVLFHAGILLFDFFTAYSRVILNMFTSRKWQQSLRKQPVNQPPIAERIDIPGE